MNATGIHIPTPADLPPELRSGMLKRTPSQVPVEVPQIDMADVPRPYGWYIIVLPPLIPKTTEGGIELVEESVSSMRAMRSIGVVLSMGPLAYSEKRGYPKGWNDPDNDGIPHIGDWVTFDSNAGRNAWMNDVNGNVIILKSLTEPDITGYVPNPKALTVLF